MRYVSKPVHVEAFKYGTDEFPEWFQKRIDNGSIEKIEANPSIGIFLDSYLVHDLIDESIIRNEDYVILDNDRVYSFDPIMFHSVFTEVKESEGSSLQIFSSIAHRLDIPLSVILLMSIEETDVRDDKKEIYNALFPVLNTLLETIWK